jgi:cyclophilin family peptidyl-prolyl cis-trans isomerase
MGTAKRERQKLGRQARVEAARVQHQRSQRKKTIRNFGIVLVLIIGAIFFFSRDSGGNKASTSSTTPGASFAYGSGPCPAADGSSTKTIDFKEPPQLCIDPNRTYTATFDTTEGSVTVALDARATPGTANNFVVLARYHYFDGTTLFRTDPSIGIIQGGSPHSSSASDPGPGYDLPDEGFNYATLSTDPTSGQPVGGPYKYVPGDLIMARASKPDGGSAQFFFGVDQNVSNLDKAGVYVKFGTTSAGLEVLQKILALHQPGGSLGGAPSRTVTVNTVTINEV